MKIVTSGNAYIDIDAYAGCIAYAELLRLQGFDAIAASTAPLNDSICQTIRSWNAPLLTAYTSTANDTFILVDISDPSFADQIVIDKNIEEVIDHHPGFQQYWNDRIGNHAQIEVIGAAATLINERWKRSGFFDQMTECSARLLVSAILDNTLNFQAQITTERDRHAYRDLLTIAALPSTWTSDYFSECQQSILNNISDAIMRDTKSVRIPPLDKPIDFSQLVIWNAQEVLNTYFEQMVTTCAKRGNPWFINLVSISAGTSYFIAQDRSTQQWLSNLFEVTFNDNVAVVHKLWLRKEIIKKALH